MEVENSAQLEDLAGKIISAATTALEPNISYDQRLLAYEFLEKTKDNTEVAIPCGFMLSHWDKSPQVRHLGLQFLEDSIRYHWNDLSLQQKLLIKENCMKLLSEGTQDILVEPIYIKDKVSRLVVEMMKREWPQQWPNLLEELEKLAGMGPTQAELVLMIFLRIAEDVATLQNLESNQRRRDLYLTLNQNMDAIFCFFFYILEKSYSKYRECSSEEEKLKNCRITQVVFSTLTCFVEWVSISCIQNHHSKFFHSTCELISDPNIRQNAVECLLQIVSRKGKPEERKFILSLFSETVMESIFKAANLAVADPLQESNYMFLKRLTQVVTTLGSQVCCLWGKESDVGEPSCFHTYLITLMAFTKHPSLTIYSYTASLWSQFFRNESICKSQAFKYFIPEWLLVAFSKVSKHGFLSENDISSQYSRLDFDSDEEYYQFFCHVRSDTCEGIKLASAIVPELLFSFMEEQFQDCLSKDSSSISENSSSSQCLTNKWDALSHIVERIMSQVIVEKKEWAIPKEKVKLLLRHCLDYQTSNPEILSNILTCISGLCLLLPSIPEVLEDVLNKLLDTTLFTGGEPKEKRTKVVKSLRKHAPSLLLKLCKTSPEIFLQNFEYIDRRVTNLIESNEISHLERLTLMQSLLILNSNYNDYQAQLEYVGKLIHSMKEDWLKLTEVFNSSVGLMEFVGLKQLPITDEETEMYGFNRSKIYSTLDLILALLNRSIVPHCKKMTEGGFILKQTDDGPIFRNPVAPQILSMIPNIFCLLRAYNGLFLQENLSKLPPDYSDIHNIPEDEKMSFLGLRPQPTQDGSKNPVQRMQTFLKLTQEHLCTILSRCGPDLGWEFYQYPHLSECLLQSVFWNCDLLPTMKFRFVVKILKPFIEGCPKEFYETTVLPLIYHLGPTVLNNLQLRWDALSSSAEDEEEDNASTEKMVNDMLLHLLTRDYIEVMSCLIREKSNSGNGKGPQQNQEIELNGDFEEEMKAIEVDGKGQNFQQEAISYLGKIVLQCDPVCQSVVMTLLRALSWPDSVSCQKAIQPLFLCIQGMLNEGHQYLNEEAVKQIFTSVLNSIHIHGQHRVNLDSLTELAVFLYEKFAKHFPVLRDVLLSLPSVNMNNIVEFEEIIKNPENYSTAKKMNKQNKFKKDSFKKVIHNIIGKSVGETLKKEVQLKNLQPIFLTRKNKRRLNLDEGSEDLNLCSLFGTPFA